jgi:hypothetical protein
LSRRKTSWTGLAATNSLLLVLIGCNYSKPDSYGETDSLPSVSSLPGGPTSPTGKSEVESVGLKRDDETRKALLASAMNLIQKASLQPGGENFRLAIQKLNQYFEGTKLAEYQLERAAHKYLSSQMPPKVVESLSDRTWSDHDTRHIEDCMMYYPVATRIAGTGETLARVRRVFEWVVQQAQLVPPGALAFGGGPQAFARPYDVLIRGMAIEAQGVWAERAWLFISLCRQLEIDAGLITYSRSTSLEAPVARYGSQFETDAPLSGSRRGPKPPIVWICAALIDGKAYLFDARVGLEVPGPDGTGVATLQDALADPAVLERMNLTGHSPYGTSRASLLASPTKIGILIESSPGYFSPKMKLLQRELTGEYRTILFRDPAEQREQFAHALGERCGDIKLWSLPFEVHDRLFHDGQFVASIQQSLFLFKREFPLIYARVKQLRGDLEGATNDYVTLRFKENAPLVTDKNSIIKADVQAGLDAYATYYLALAQLEKARLNDTSLEQAGLLFRNTLELLPEPGPSQPYYQMLRWGANTNLARIYEAMNDGASAISYGTQRDPTSQGYGNLLRARELVWRDPIAAPKVALPAAPAPSPIVAPPAADPRQPGPRRGPNAAN